MKVGQLPTVPQTLTANGALALLVDVTEKMAYQMRLAARELPDAEAKQLCAWCAEAMKNRDEILRRNAMHELAALGVDLEDVGYEP